MQRHPRSSIKSSLINNFSLAVFSRSAGHISPSSAGISLSYALQITTQLNLCVRMITELEGTFNAVERVQEYIALEAEAAREGPAPPQGWPDQGKVEVDDLIMSYRPGLPPVLKVRSIYL